MILLIRKIDLSGSFNIMGDRYTYNLNVASLSVTMLLLTISNLQVACKTKSLFKRKNNQGTKILCLISDVFFFVPKKNLYVAEEWSHSCLLLDFNNSHL